jgi:ParB family chromosome partitioning protein
VTVAGKRIDLSDLADEPVFADAKVPAIAGPPRIVPVDRVAVNPLNTRDVGRRPRKVTELAKSIRSRGQLQPCAVVTRDAFLRIYSEYETDIGAARFVQVTGARRHAAILEAGLPHIEVVVKDELAASRSEFVAATAAENLDREDYDPVEEAHAVQHLVNEFGSKSGVADHMGRSNGWVTQKLSLLKLIPEVQAALRVDENDETGERRLPAREVREWHNLDDAGQLTALEEWRRSFTAVKRGQPAGEQTTPPQPRRSRVQMAIQRLGGTPAAIAASLRAELAPEHRHALAEELMRD